MLYSTPITIFQAWCDQNAVIVTCVPAIAYFDCSSTDCACILVFPADPWSGGLIQGDAEFKRNIAASESELFGSFQHVVIGQVRSLLLIMTLQYRSV